jgi:hypothetical protein
MSPCDEESSMARSNCEVADRRREHWRELLRRWQASGISQAQFCRRRGIPVWKFAWWKKRLSDEHPAADGLFVPVRVAPSTASCAELELTLRGGRLLRFGADVPPARLAEIVAALEACPTGPRTEGSSC